MKTLRLILPDTDDPGQARSVWQHACDEAGYVLEIHAADDPDIRNITRELGLNTYPALLLANRIIAVGTPDADSARQILERLGKSPTP